MVFVIKTILMPNLLDFRKKKGRKTRAKLRTSQNNSINYSKMTE